MLRLDYRLTIDRLHLKYHALSMVIIKLEVQAIFKAHPLYFRMEIRIKGFQDNLQEDNSENQTQLF